MTSVLDTRSLPVRSTSTENAAEPVDSVLFNHAKSMAALLSPTNDDERLGLVVVLGRPSGTQMTSYTYSNRVSTSTSSSIATVPVLNRLVDPTFLEAIRKQLDQRITMELSKIESEAERNLKSTQRTKDRRAAILAGVLSGLGIRPRRPRQLEDRLQAALIRSTQSEIVDARY